MKKVSFIKDKNTHLIGSVSGIQSGFLRCRYMNSHLHNMTRNSYTKADFKLLHEIISEKYFVLKLVKNNLLFNTRTYLSSILYDYDHHPYKIYSRLSIRNYSDKRGDISLNIFQLIFKMDFKDLPLHLSQNNLLNLEIIKWRLKIGK